MFPGFERRESRSRGSAIRDNSQALLAAGNRGNEEDTIAFFEGAGFAAKEADVFLVEINIEELADLASFVANVAGEVGEASGERVKSFGDSCGATVDFRCAVREAAEGGGDFDGDGHCVFSWFRFVIVDFENSRV
jgi:hypothetical protein